MVTRRLDTLPNENHAMFVGLGGWPHVDLSTIVVHPLRLDERHRFDAMLDEHHWLGHHLFGETVRYVAELEDGTWVALGSRSRVRFCGVGQLGSGVVNL